MGKLNKRIKSTSDSYYVWGEGAREARIRRSNNRVIEKFGMSLVFFGMAIIIIGYIIPNRNVLIIGILTFIASAVIGVLYRRKRNRE